MGSADRCSVLSRVKARSLPYLLACACVALLLATPATAWAQESLQAQGTVAGPGAISTVGEESSALQDATESGLFLREFSETPSFTSYSDATAYVRQCLVARETSFSIKLKVASGVITTGDQLLEYGHLIIDAAMAETGNPFEGDYLRWCYRSFVGTYKYVSNGYFLFQYSFTYYSSASQEAQVIKAVDDIAASLDLDGASDYDKVVAIHDWLVEHVAYDTDHVNDSSYSAQYTAWAAVTQGTCVCQGYATLFYALCLHEGVSARLIAGMNHAWNIVRIGGAYYNVDCTWDADSPDSRAFFLRGEAEFGVDHVRDDGSHSVVSIDYTGDAFNNACPVSINDYQGTSPLTGWNKIEGHWYLLSDDGTLASGWQRDEGSWYYIQRSGRMATGWQKVDGSWYYLKASGRMATGWQKVDGSWYYLKASGRMATGWYGTTDASGAKVWYYLKANGKMAASCWGNLGGKWYWFAANGRMATGRVLIKGYWYTFNASGAWKGDKTAA